MAVDMFMKIDDLKGESEVKGHEKSMELLSWSWGMSQSGSAHSGPGGGAGKVSVQDLTFTKYIDAATPNLIKFCCNGKHFKEATLTVRKAGGSSIDYLTIKLSTVLISSVQTGATSSDDRITENVTLNFAKFDLEYKPQTSGGSAGAGSSISWNIASNAEK